MIWSDKSTGNDATNGPPRIAFPNPVDTGNGQLKSSGCLQGPFTTGLTGTEYAQYNRSLYGAAVAWRSQATTKYAEPDTLVRAFGSQAQSAPGHSEFLGTGGSLYYLKHTGILPGSQQVVLEIRDPTTGSVINRVTLANGVDYEIDYFQGVITLAEPLNSSASGSGIIGSTD